MTAAQEQAPHLERQAAMDDDHYRRELEGGLVLRWSRPEDAEPVVRLYSQVFRPSAEAPPNQHIPIWTRDLFSGRHPHIGPHDFALVEDTASGTLVAATCLLRYTCEYEGIPFGFGRPEVVASLPEHRNKGLIRAIFELIHARSTVRGDLVQGITGIPYFYRQFGYEFAAELDHNMTVAFAAIPQRKLEEREQPEPYTLRPATVDDIPQLRRLSDRERAGSVISARISEDYWRWILQGMDPKALERWRVYSIVDTQGRGVGYLQMAPGRWGAAAAVDGLMVEPGTPLASVLPPVLRGLQPLAEATTPIRPETPPAGAINFRLHTGHPLRAALGDIAYAARPYTYAWYLRVADLPGFLRHIAPVLERRLAESAMSGYHGELTLDFYRGGLRLAFEHGRLTAAEDWRKSLYGEGKAGFPPLVFLQALFGYRSLDELRYCYADVWAEQDAAPLLETLFPARSSRLIPMD